MSTILGKSTHDDNVNIFCSVYNWPLSTITYSRFSDDNSKIGLKDETHIFYKEIKVHWIPWDTPNFSWPWIKETWTIPAILYGPGIFSTLQHIKMIKAIAIFQCFSPSDIFGCRTTDFFPA